MEVRYRRSYDRYWPVPACQPAGSFWSKETRVPSHNPSFVWFTEYLSRLRAEKLLGSKTAGKVKKTLLFFTDHPRSPRATTDGLARKRQNPGRNLPVDPRGGTGRPLTARRPTPGTRQSLREDQERKVERGLVMCSNQGRGRISIQDRSDLFTHTHRESPWP
jgi:hypothetical protein